MKAEKILPLLWEMLYITALQSNSTTWLFVMGKKGG